METTDPHEHQPQCVDLCPICRGADVLRATGSSDVREGWQSVQREALLTMRTMIDHYLERLDGAAAHDSPRVEEIPIE